MRKKKILMMLALLLTLTTQAWADEWATVYMQTQTKQSDWTALNAGSTTGRTLGSAGNTTYYYVTGSLSFTNSTAGGSGLTIQGTVYLYIPTSVTLTCTGANADGQTGAGAGVELAEGNTLYLVGGGTLVANGGNAANGGNGGNGGNAECTYDTSILGGSGGTGGNGGGGAGAGIGTRGGNGGNGGAGGQRNGSYGQETTQYGVDGNAGSAGGTAGSMGTVNKMGNITLNAKGGAAGSDGTGGNRGLTASQHPGSNVYMASGGGGGGAGGFGGGASNIGTGGGGGGGGGGGAAGNVAWVVYSGTANGYYHAGAKGGKGGKNGNGTSAPDGTSIELTNPKYADIQGGGLRDSADDYDDDDGWESGNAWHEGGDGGSCGIPTRGGAVGTVLTANGDGTWTIASMPAFDVELQIEYETALALSETADNTAALGEWNGCEADVTLSGRTLYKDGKWNTICLPFDVTLAGSPLDGATARALTSASIEGTTLTLTFGDAVTTLEAGTPYIIKWESGDNLVSPVFSGVTIDATDRSYDNSASGDQRVRFMGTYKSTEFDAEDKSILLMGGGNTLYYPTAGAGIGAQRAYFKIGSDGALLARRLTAFNIDFGDDEATGIISTTNYTNDTNSDAWFTLDGRRLSAKPSRAGVYINNGIKVVIK